MSTTSARWEYDDYEIRDLHLRICVRPPPDTEPFTWIRDRVARLQTATATSRIVWRRPSRDMHTYTPTHNWNDFIRRFYQLR